MAKKKKKPIKIRVVIPFNTGTRKHKGVEYNRKQKYKRIEE